MRRMNIKETGDVDWFPQNMRDFETDVLVFSLTHFKMYDDVVPFLARCLERTGTTEITDMCSAPAAPGSASSLSSHVISSLRSMSR